ncbi:dihydrofolate reductase [Candidatus Gottesmanbacteria bacterium]|nr:dihydrofolate reductase [Candidatus Gottesmanbacteria bacterium]
MNKTIISIIAAIGKNRELGKNNKLLWSLPGDMKRFRDKTRNHPIIMGRKTFESIGRVLRHRTNIIVTRNKDYKVPGAYVFPSIDKAIEFAVSARQGEIFIIGGAQIYQQSISIADKLYLTIIDKSYPEADACFPDYSKFTKKVYEEKITENDLNYVFIDLEK